MTQALMRVMVLVLLSALASACASVPRAPVVTAPKFPAYLEPAIPATVEVPADLRDRHQVAWRWLQAGDPRRAAREFQTILKRAPGFVPSMTGLGYALLADRNHAAAAAQFSAALATQDAYLPAWVGRAEADIALDDDGAAVVALERILALDPTREGVRARLDLVRFRRLQGLIERGTTARVAGRLDEARLALQEALGLSPSSTLILRELVALEQRAGNSARAEEHARRLVQADAADPEHLALLAELLEAQDKIEDAASFYAKAAAIDPREVWRAKAVSLRTRAEIAALPDAIRAIPSATSITRGDVAAYLALKLGALLATAPTRPAQVATDIRGHWAARWIPPVTRAGVMRVYDNHTFRPSTVVRRGDLAEVVASLLELPGAGRPADLVRWRAARPGFADLPPTHVFYRPAALAVAAGVLSADSAGRFQSTRAATGAELASAVDRITQLTQRR